MSDTEEPPFPIALCTVLAAVIFFTVKVVQRLTQTTNTSDTEEESYMFELLSRAAKYVQRPKKYTTNREQQDACLQILLAIERPQYSVESDVEKVMLYTLTADTFAYWATLHAISEEGNDARDESNNFARMDYARTTKFAKTALAADHPERLRLAIKYSTFLSGAYGNRSAARRVSYDAWMAASLLEVIEARRGRGGEDIDPESERLRGLLWVLFTT